ncbi:MAG: T9SS type A sorting domain-containing protein, partial [Bacteroidota bacterium]
MNRILLIIFCFGFLGGSAQLTESNLFQNKEGLDPMPSPKASFQPIFKNVPVLEEDFQAGIPGLPAGWETNEVEQLDDQGNPLGTFVNAFVTGSSDEANNGGFFPVPDIAGNTFAYANDDGPPCNCDMIDAYLQTPMMDFTDLTNAAVTFNAFQDGNFGSGDWTVQASTDGANWTTEFTSTAADDASAEWKEVVVTLFEFDGEAQVWLRFQWSDASSWASGFAIDNVVVDEILDNNLSLQEVFSADPNNPDLANVVIEYTQVPLEQTVPLWVGAAVSNNGVNTQTNIVVTAEVFMNGSSQGTFNSAPFSSLDFLELDSIFIETGYTPDALGEVEIQMSVSADVTDENLANNSGSESFLVTSDTYASDDGVVTLFQSNATNEFRSANLFEMPVGGTSVYGLAVAFGAGLTDPTQPGTICEVELLNSDFDFLVGAEHEISDDQISEAGESNFGIIAFEEEYEAEEGEVVMGSVHHFGGSSAENVRVGLSGQSIPQTSFFQDELGEWFFTLNTPMIRLITSPITSLEDVQFENGMKLLQNYPNPFNDNTVIEFEIAQSEEVSIELRDMNGRLLLSKSFGILNAGSKKWSFNAAEFSNGFYT